MIKDQTKISKVEENIAIAFQNSSTTKLGTHNKCWNKFFQKVNTNAETNVSKREHMKSFLK